MADLGNNSVMFTEPSPCDEVVGNVELCSNTWDHHIQVRHPEVKDVEHLRATISNPAYVASSKPGPNAAHLDNVVFVSDIIRLRSGRLHVFVESPKHSPKITTAMYSKRRYHGEVLWINDVQISYDSGVDVLYISKQNAVEALTEEEDDGLLFRYSLQDDAPCGVTVVAFQKGWNGHQTTLAHRVSEFLGVPFKETERAIASMR